MAERKVYTTSRLWRRLKPKARAFRAESTPAEALLWERLRNRALPRAKFRRQHPIGRFVVDFCCPTADLVIGLVGVFTALGGAEDTARQALLKKLGFRVLRFANVRIENDIEGVLRDIECHLNRKDRVP